MHSIYVHANIEEPYDVYANYKTIGHERMRIGSRSRFSQMLFDSYYIGIQSANCFLSRFFTYS